MIFLCLYFKSDFESDFRIRFRIRFSNLIFKSDFQIRFSNPIFESYFIMLFDAGLQCEFIRTFIIRGILWDTSNKIHPDHHYLMSFKSTSNSRTLRGFSITYPWFILTYSLLVGKWPPMMMRCSHKLELLLFALISIELWNFKDLLHEKPSSRVFFCYICNGMMGSFLCLSHHHPSNVLCTKVQI